MENVNITSIEFDKSMPLWATNETLDKLNKLLVKETQLSRKDINKLTTIVSKIVTQNKSTASDGKNITKEVAKTDKTLNKILSQLSTLNKNIIKANQQSSKTGAAQSSNNNIQNNKNTTAPAKMSKATQSEIKHDVNIRMNQALTQQMAFIHKSVSRHSGIMKQVSARFDMSIKRMETVVNKQDKLNAKIGGALERMVGIMGSMTKDGIKIKGTIDSTEKFKSSKNEVQESKPDGRQFGIMRSITKRLEAPNRDRDIFNRNSRRFSRNNNVKRRTLSPVRGTPKNPALAVLTSFGKVLGTVVKGLKTFIGVLGKLNVVGAIVTGAKALYNSMDDIIIERRKMLQSGFSFAKEAEGFDGAKLRATMNDSGLTMERGLKAMEKNATLVNKLGVQPFLKTIGELTADGGVGSLLGDLGMTIPEIDDYASQYMSTLQRLGDSERLREDSRARATENFIRQADQMGKVTGLGTKAILDNVLKIQQDVKYRIAMNNLDKKQRENMEAFTARMVAFTGGDERAAQAFTMAALDPAGRGLLASEEGQKMHSVFSQAGMGDIFTNFNEFAKNAKNMSSEEQGAYLANVVTDMQSRGESFTEAQKAQLYLLAEQDDKFGGALVLLLNQLDMADPEKYRDAVKSNLTGDEQTGTRKDAALAAAAAQKENLVSEALDTDIARAAYANTNELIIKTADTFTEGTKGILDGLRSVIDTMTSLFKKIISPFESLISVIRKFPGMGGNDDDEPENKTTESSEPVNIHDQIIDSGMGELAAGMGNDNTSTTKQNSGNVIVEHPKDTQEQRNKSLPILEESDAYKQKRQDYERRKAERQNKNVIVEHPKDEPKVVEPEQPKEQPLPTAVSVMTKEIELAIAEVNRREDGLENIKTLEQSATTDVDRENYREMIANAKEQIEQAKIQHKILLDMLDAIKRDNSMIKNASQ